MDYEGALQRDPKGMKQAEQQWEQHRNAMAAEGHQLPDFHQMMRNEQRLYNKAMSPEGQARWRAEIATGLYVPATPAGVPPQVYISAIASTAAAVEGLSAVQPPAEPPKATSRLYYHIATIVLSFAMGWAIANYTDRETEGAHDYPYVKHACATAALYLIAVVGDHVRSRAESKKEH